ncbi:C-type lectin domain family 5 member A isoform X3 [Bubalus bubalis]|uniref:C-type lectin domain family 5 member A isoform X3 n=1 Tax=Bubalus bubalis TaxID=89462 RepID=UPI001D126A8E|nr:C-type lectin domain family 5 member A isoform X3 [Bubalus bubalis]
MLVRQRLCEEGRTLPTHRSLFSLEGPPPATPSTRPLGKIPTCRPDQPSRETSGLLISCIMNWHMIISALIVVVLKIVGMTLFLLYFPQIFGENNAIFIPTESSGTVPQILGNGTVSFTPTESYGTVCPKGWDFHQGRCFFLSKSESSWNKSMNFCKEKGSTLAIVNTPEKMHSRNLLDPVLLLLLLSHFSHVQLCETPQTAAHQAPLSLGFSRQEYWSGLPLPSTR